MVSTSPVIPNIAKADRPELLQALQQSRSYKNEWLKREIVENRRIDLFASQVLGYMMEPFHLAMAQYQMKHHESLILAPRGGGKSTIGDVTKICHMLACDRNLRILIASKTKSNAQSFLKEIKTHLESNTRLIELFGPFFDPHKTSKWDNSEIEVLGRTRVMKEPSVSCVGVDSAVVSKHYDVIISDDLVDEENARTKNLREKTKSWYYQSLLPTLEPPDSTSVWRGQHHHLGTRYHYDDQYGHLIENELKDHHLVISALSQEGYSFWPTKFPSTLLLQKKRRAGTIIFNAQFQNDCEAMKGEIFRYDDCIQLNEEDWPDSKLMKIFMGVDLAIKESEATDQFAVVVVGVIGKIDSGTELYYVLDHYAGQLRFSDQTDKIIKMYKKWDPIRGFIESNAYQLSQFQEVARKHPGTRMRPKQTDKDKTTRAWKLSPLLESGRVFFQKHVSDLLIEQLVLFPNHKRDDLFDALDLAISAAKRGARKLSARKEPGLL